MKPRVCESDELLNAWERNAWLARVVSLKRSEYYLTPFILQISLRLDA